MLGIFTKLDHALSAALDRAGIEIILNNIRSKTEVIAFSDLVTYLYFSSMSSKAEGADEISTSLAFVIKDGRRDSVSYISGNNILKMSLEITSKGGYRNCFHFAPENETLRITLPTERINAMREWLHMISTMLEFSHEGQLMEYNGDMYLPIGIARKNPIVSDQDLYLLMRKALKGLMLLNGIRGDIFVVRYAEPEPEYGEPTSERIILWQEIVENLDPLVEICNEPEDLRVQTALLIPWRAVIALRELNQNLVPGVVR